MISATAEGLGRQSQEVLMLNKAIFKSQVILIN